METMALFWSSDAVEHHVQGELAHAAPQLANLIGHLFQRAGIVLFDGQLQQDARVFEILFQAFEGLDALAQPRALL